MPRLFHIYAKTTPTHLYANIPTNPPSLRHLHSPTERHRMVAQSEGHADISGEELHEILREIDTNMNGQVELDEYLQVGGAEYVLCH